MTDATAHPTFAAIWRQSPPARDFFAVQGLPAPRPDQTPAAYFAALPPEALTEAAGSASALSARFEAFLTALSRLTNDAPTVASLTVHGGRGKDGRPETLDLTLVPGDVVALAGPTGSGKSRFLADVEWLADADTPTGRRVLINGQPADASRRLAASGRLIAQLSQNMHFVMDLTVGEFLIAHAESRLLADAPAAAAEVTTLANELAGEPFSPTTPLTSLSGGQSRALMIADVARLCASPIVLVDEIENAGIDRRKAISLLTGHGKIVLMATHDPLLALTAGRRLVFAAGAVAAVIETSPEEKASLAALAAADARLSALRDDLRLGRHLQFPREP
ncbi:ATP-binding cassette domain-containing protein [Desulfovibrio sp. TomC]|uniref:ATP-binding cassette domain-containing protein n=1 Tax=Desulfovibrio sp. TomC TaxID=1562888 RepID=UPI000574E65B|nr:ATP-binding cassette domain-containing protein [Desulfovibrio sp. TomC]KHK01460.1 putative ABC transporter [Desulfovibrio sp. TomC]